MTRKPQTRQVGVCTRCGRERTIIGRGLCNPCYVTESRRRSRERGPIPPKPEPQPEPIPIPVEVAPEPVPETRVQYGDMVVYVGPLVAAWLLGRGNGKGVLCG